MSEQFQLNSKDSSLRKVAREGILSMEPENRADFLRKLLRKGEISRDRLLLAVQLGDTVAAEVIEEDPIEFVHKSFSYKEWFDNVQELVSVDDLKHLLTHISLNTLNEATQMMPADYSRKELVENAITILRGYIDNPSNLEGAEELFEVLFEQLRSGEYDVENGEASLLQISMNSIDIVIKDHNDLDYIKDKFLNQQYNLMKFLRRVVAEDNKANRTIQYNLFASALEKLLPVVYKDLV